MVRLHSVWSAFMVFLVASNIPSILGILEGTHGTFG
jgi:hypothetical protein